MLPLLLGPDRKRLRVLCLGAHSDDIEIGCAGTLSRWLHDYERLDVTWCVMSASGDRAGEATRSAKALMRKAASLEIVLGSFEDACLPAEFRAAKDFLTDLRRRTEADVVLTHALHDRHQDHRLISELSWQVWRDHLILEYEIPKYEGDLAQPNCFVALGTTQVRRKVEHLLRHFGSQRSKAWFDAETFRGLMRLRGVEARAPSGYAEAFHVRKLVL